MGYSVLRYWNNDVLSDIETVLDDIWNCCFDSPFRRFAPPSPGGGRGVSQEELDNEIK